MANKKVPAFAKTLQEARAAKNWSLRDVEKKTGNNLSRTTILRAEEGIASLPTLLSLAKLYGIKKADTDKLVESFNDHERKKASWSHDSNGEPLVA